MYPKVSALLSRLANIRLAVGLDVGTLVVGLVGEYVGDVEGYT
jgi:hypothetical protein